MAEKVYSGRSKREREREREKERERLNLGGRNYIPANELALREVHSAVRVAPSTLIDDPRLLRPVAAARPHPALIGERITVQQHEIQTLFRDNQRIVADNVALKQELAAAQEELRHLSAAASTVKVETDAQVREVYERSLKVDAEARSIEGFKVELVQVREDIQKLTADRNDLTAKLQMIDVDLVKTSSEQLHFPEIKAEIETMRKEIQRGRAAVEYEKKTYASNIEQGREMEKHMIALAHEIEKLHTELANAEKRARATVAAAAAATPGYINSDMGYSGTSNPESYAMHQVETGADTGDGPISHDPSDMHIRHHVHR